MPKRSISGNKNANNYYDVLKHIEDIKNRNKISRTEKTAVPERKGEEEKTLFYGVDYIDNI